MNQEHAEGPAHSGEDYGPDVVIQPQHGDLPDQGDQNDLLGQGHSAHNQSEQDSPAPEPLFCQGIAGHRGGDTG